MFTKFHKHMRNTAIFSLILIFALSAAWATNSYFKSKTMSIGSGWFTNVVHQGKDRIKVYARDSTLDNYLIEQGLQQAVLWVYLEETWIDTGGGNGYYQLDFTFGPSGAYFEEPLEIEMRGKYVCENNEVQMYDEYGEIVESTSNGNGSVITYYITTSPVIAMKTMIISRLGCIFSLRQK